MRSKFFITDEGFGPIVRQSAIIEELVKLEPSLEITLQLDRFYKEAQHIIPGINYRRQFNNIIWHKNEDGTPDFHSIRKYYSGYQEISNQYLKEEPSLASCDFIVSDFVYEAFEAARRDGIPSYGVSHFTWDWFFSKMYPPPIPGDVIRMMMERASMARILFFPPFTPREITEHYREKVVEVPLIVRKHRANHLELQNKKPNILMMDSGSRLNRLAMEQIVAQLTELDSYHFYLPGHYDAEADNITTLPENDLLVDYIGKMDLVVSRAGFNTITECIAYRTPMLLFGEILNAEMRENTHFVKEQGLGSFTSLEVLKNQPEKVLGDLFDGEYPVLKRNMDDHDIRVDGARVVAEKILDDIH